MKIKIENAAIEIKGETILENINFEINDSEHIAIVGRNGSGKTTLLNSIIDNSMLSVGIGEKEFKVTKIGNIKIGYLKQIKINEELTLLEELSSSYKEIINTEKRIKKLEKNLDNEKNIKEYSDLMENYKQLGGYTYLKDVSIMINKFGFNEEEKNKLISDFSGGEKMKISFMKLLLSAPDLLILDEPTNHLDMNTIEWLETYLKNYKKAFIIVSHDRMFLDNTVNIIYDIEYGETIRYVGNYTKFVKLKKERQDKLEKDYEYQQKEIKRLNDVFLRFRYKPTKASMAMSKLKQIERINLIDKPRKENTKTFNANTKDILKPGKKVLSVKEISFGYDKVLGKLSLEVERGKKIGIIGANGIGKSTLLKTLCSIIKPIEGKVTYGYNVKYGYFDQNLEFTTNGTIIEEFQNKYPDLDNEEIRKALGAFLFTGLDVNKELKVLSGGEKVRLLLCEIFYSKSNLLFLDEPTNHLDMISKENLEKTLKEYPETIMFVSHDRYFVKQVADEVIAFENNNIKHYKYGYDEYIEDKNNNINVEVIEEKGKKEIVKREKNSLIKVESQLNKLYKKLDILNNEMMTEEIYLDYNKASTLQKEIDELNMRIKDKEEEWESLL